MWEKNILRTAWITELRVRTLRCTNVQQVLRLSFDTSLGTEPWSVCPKIMPYKVLHFGWCVHAPSYFRKQQPWPWAEELSNLGLQLDLLLLLWHSKQTRCPVIIHKLHIHYMFYSNLFCLKRCIKKVSNISETKLQFSSDFIYWCCRFRHHSFSTF